MSARMSARMYYLRTPLKERLILKEVSKGSLQGTPLRILEGTSLKNFFKELLKASSKELSKELSMELSRAVLLRKQNRRLLKDFLRQSLGISKEVCLRRSLRKTLSRRCICLRVCII